MGIVRARRFEQACRLPEGPAARHRNFERDFETGSGLCFAGSDEFVSAALETGRHHSPVGVPDVAKLLPQDGIFSTRTRISTRSLCSVDIEEPRHGGPVLMWPPVSLQSGLVTLRDLGPFCAGSRPLVLPKGGLECETSPSSVRDRQVVCQRTG